MALHKREIVLLCAVAFAHFLAVGLIFSGNAATMQTDDGASTLVVMLRSDIVPLAEPANRQGEIAPQEANPAEIVSPTQSENRKFSHPEDMPRPKAKQHTVDDKQKTSHGAPDLSGKSPSGNVGMPPSSRLIYSTKTVANGEERTGRGQILWESSKRHFSIRGEFNVQQANILYFSSEGMIGQDSGLESNIYVEKRKNDLPANIHFQREKNSVWYSLSSESQSLGGSELDPASAIWQLVRLGHHDGAKFSPGAVFELRVAGVKGIEEWLVEVVALDAFDTPIGRLNAWHLARAANFSTGGRALDVWLAPEKDWFPVRLLYSDAEGGYSEMLIAEIVALPNR